ncbi:MFS transporter [Croceibacterium sp. LX-88]|uniref:MFS transporter n=1 Tax=Croceibacterium selenioxidans TaxID=2838833 RepID=A0ABS5W6H5_9SPHN|nr:MFS transporter [Croceibacterium selenioxidans]MBT2135348.1 MFS transporter [Croceibacterium selenioxidans]
MNEDAPSVSRRTAVWVLFLLFLANVLNAGDRGLLGLVTEQVRGELSLSDTQMSLANGLFFTVFNLVGGLFLSRMIDRGNRTRILAFGIAGWSIATAATGLATDFATLAIARIGVGIGEATAFPAAMSLIPDLFRAQARGRAVAVFQSSAFIGIVGGAIAAGVLAAAIGWRAMFFWAGGVGVVLALVMLATATEPARGEDARPAAPAGTFADLSQGLLRLWHSPGLARLVVGYGTASMLTSVLAAWGPAFLQRSHDVPLSQVGVAIGPAVGIGGITGTLFAGFLADAVRRRTGSAAATLWLPIVTLPLSVPCVLGFAFLPSLSLAMASAALMNFLLACAIIPSINFAVESAAPGDRGLTATVMLAAAGLIGSTLGPFIVGVLSDYLNPTLGEESLRYGIAAMAAAPLVGTAFIVAARISTGRAQAESLARSAINS